MKIWVIAAMLAVSTMLWVAPAIGDSWRCEEAERLVHDFQDDSDRALAAVKGGRGGDACSTLKTMLDHHERAAHHMVLCARHVEETVGSRYANRLRAAWRREDQRPAMRQALRKYCSSDSETEDNTIRTWSRADFESSGVKTRIAKSEIVATVDGLPPHAHIWYACLKPHDKGVETISILLDSAPYAKESQDAEISIWWDTLTTQPEHFRVKIHEGSDLNLDPNDTSRMKRGLMARNTAYITLPSPTGKSFIYRVNLAGSANSIRWAGENCRIPR